MASQKEDIELVIKVAGHPKQRFYVGIVPYECADIQDGVSFTPEGEGGWVVSYQDIIAIAKAAAEKRGFRLYLEKKTRKDQSESTAG